MKTLHLPSRKKILVAAIVGIAGAFALAVTVAFQVSGSLDRFQGMLCVDSSSGGRHVSVMFSGFGFDSNDDTHSTDIAHVASSATYALDQRFIATEETEANSLMTECYLDLIRVTTSKKPLPYVRNLGRRAIGRSGWSQLESEELYEQKCLARSPHLFVILTPDIQYYVATQPDRDHMLHKCLIPTDGNTDATIAEIMRNYWRPWTKQAAEIMRKPS